MSLGGLRDPHDPSRDTYSQLEADAIAYAVSKGVLVVAAVGNSDQSPSEPWPYAELAGRAAPCARRQRAQPQGRCAGVLEPRPAVQRPRRAGRGHPLDVPARAHRRASGLRRAGVLELRPGGVPDGRGHELRRASGDGRRRDALRDLAEPHRRSGGNAPRAERRRCRACERLRGVHGRPRPVYRRRAARPSRCPRAPRGGGAAARPLRAERRRRHGLVPALRLQPPDRRHARLLERSRRRLPRLPAKGRAPRRQRRLIERDPSRARALATGHGHGRLWRAAVTASRRPSGGCRAELRGAGGGLVPARRASDPRDAGPVPARRHEDR